MTREISIPFDFLPSGKTYPGVASSDKRTNGTNYETGQGVSSEKPSKLRHNVVGSEPVGVIQAIVRC